MQTISAADQTICAADVLLLLLLRVEMLSRSHVVKQDGHALYVALSCVVQPAYGILHVF